MLGNLIVFYLFLGGVGAGATGALVVLSLLTPGAFVYSKRNGHLYGRPNTCFRRFFGPGFLAAFFALCLGIVCLMGDVGRVDRLLLLFLRPSVSYLSLGAVALALLALLSGVLAWVWGVGEHRIRSGFLRFLEVLTAAFSLIVMVYTGLLLQSIQAMALWSSPFVPVLFVISSLSTGIALVVAATYFAGSSKRFGTTLVKLSRVDVVLVVIEMLCLAAFLMVMLHNESTRESASTLIMGELSSVFWMGLVLFGLVIPLVLELLSKRGKTGRLVVSAILILQGGFCLRWCIASAGVGPDVMASAMKGLGLS